MKYLSRKHTITFPSEFMPTAKNLLSSNPLTVLDNIAELIFFFREFTKKTAPVVLESAALICSLSGNNHMKEENYRCAVECYTKAIDLDLSNAVYYCNRYFTTRPYCKMQYEVYIYFLHTSTFPTHTGPG